MFLVGPRGVTVIVAVTCTLLSCVSAPCHPVGSHCTVGATLRLNIIILSMAYMVDMVDLVDMFDIVDLVDLVDTTRCA